MRAAGTDQQVVHLFQFLIMMIKIILMTL